MALLEILHFAQEECPAAWREQIIGLMRQEWPRAFEGGPVVWPDCPDTHPTSFVLLSDRTVVSHVAVPRKEISHKGQSYQAFGISEVVTHPDCRRQGYGARLLKEAAAYIAGNSPDISLFTCVPSLVPFYAHAGWEHYAGTVLVGGTRDNPFRSDSLGLATMMRLYSDKARRNRHAFQETDIELELGERKLW